MLKIRLGELAFQQMFGIEDYSTVQWGSLQAQKYMKKMYAGFERLAQHEHGLERKKLEQAPLREAKVEHYYIEATEKASLGAYTSLIQAVFQL